MSKCLFWRVNDSINKSINIENYKNQFNRLEGLNWGNFNYIKVFDWKYGCQIG